MTDDRHMAEALVELAKLDTIDESIAMAAARIAYTAGYEAALHDATSGAATDEPHALTAASPPVCLCSGRRGVVVSVAVCVIGKTTYPTRHAASKARQHVRPGNRAQIHGELQVYRCPRCGGFHLGHRSRHAG